MNMIFHIVFIAQETDSKLMPVQNIQGENFLYGHMWLLALRQTSDHSRPLPILSDLWLKYKPQLPVLF